jgi:prepilin-type N-terminal cleavage/methylation domain-containing protein
MKIENCHRHGGAGKLKISNKAFTLIEIMIAIAIVGILAGAMLVSSKGFGVKARSAKAQAQMASVVPNMISCWGNGGKVVKPDSAGGNGLCVFGTSTTPDTNYGTWPSFTGDLDSYDFSAPNATLAADMCQDPLLCMKRDAWYFYVTSSSSNDDRKICCTKVGGGCASTIKAASATCNGSGWVD